MAAVVKLDDIIEAMELPEEWEALIDPDTGEVVVTGEDDRFVLDGGEEGEATELPAWQQESIAKIRRVLDSGRAIALPGAFEIHEWDLMRTFSSSVQSPDAAAELLEAIHGSGAFRRFKIAVARLGLRDQWFKYRDEAVRDLARMWLEEVGITYVE